MKETKSDYVTHVFVCTNTKKNGTGCAPLGADQLRASLKDWTREKPEWRGKIRVNSSGCLDRCTEGVACAIYPQNKWFVEARNENLDELKQVITDLMNEK